MEREGKTVKIGFIASSGGHWEELMCLKKIALENDTFYVTEAGGQAEESNLEPLYRVPQINRKEKHFFLHFMKLFGRAFSILHKEKPKVLITTGALAAYPFCVVQKLRRGKVVYVESFARVNNASLTGKLVYPFADLFLVQWEPMVEVYPKAKYVGGIF